MVSDQSRNDFRQALSLLSAAVNIITTDGPHGRFGLTASAVCSVTDAPPHHTGLHQPQQFNS